MIHECIKCKEDFLTEADPFIVFPKPSGSEFQCLRCYQQREAKLVEALKKAIGSAYFYSRHADCRKDSWACNCEFCRDKDSSKNLREAREVLKELGVEV